MVERLQYIDFYRREITDKLSEESFDIFISAYNDNERISNSYSNVKAEKKYYLLFSEYKFTSPPDGIVITDYACLILFFDSLDLTKKICIDITGFIRPYLVFIVKILKQKKIRMVSFIYSEPVQYNKHHDTVFSQGERIGVEEITGFANESPEVSISNKYLIVGNGFDTNAFIEVTSKYKDIITENQYLLIGFPSLKPDMFQQSMLKIHDLDKGHYSFIFAPASNPFMTAQKLEDTINSFKINCDETISVYLAPLSTKPQVLGFALYAVRNEELPDSGIEVNIVYPFSEHYSHETSKGIAKIWMYKIDFENNI